MAGMIDLVVRGEIDSDSEGLYAHLGGQPGVGAPTPGLFDVRLATHIGAVRACQTSRR